MTCAQKQTPSSLALVHSTKLLYCQLAFLYTPLIMTQALTKPRHDSILATKFQVLSLCKASNSVRVNTRYYQIRLRITAH